MECNNNLIFNCDESIDFPDLNNVSHCYQDVIIAFNAAYTKLMRMTLKKGLLNSVFGKISLYLSEGESPNVCCFLEIGFALELTKLEISALLMAN